MSSIFVVVYPDVQYNINAPGVLYYRQWPSELSGPLPTQPETQPHFIGRYRPPSHTFLRSLRENPATDYVQAPGAPETNVHFLGRHQAPVYQRFRYTSEDAVSSTLLPQPETNTHFLGRFQPPHLDSFRLNFTPSDAPLATQPETNVHFLGRYSGATYTFLRNLRENPATDFVVGPGPAETNTHFIGRFQEARIRRLEGLWRNPAGDIGAAPPPGPLPILEVHQKMHTHPPAGPGTPIYRNV